VPNDFENGGFEGRPPAAAGRDLKSGRAGWPGREL
jgi:hypothetical protein